SLTVDTSTNDLYVSYIDGDNDDVYHHRATYSAGPTWSWGGAVLVAADASEVFTNLSANETGNARVLAIWTVDDGSPYHIGTSYVLIPERLLFLFLLGPVLPKLLKKKKGKGKKKRSSRCSHRQVDQPTHPHVKTPVRKESLILIR
ncbi:hypothetical protein MUP65_01085, partial [Patescibacteria group bacterium]|nr:hypothetical protein [Patescibacteria group bacterium]